MDQFARNYLFVLTTVLVIAAGWYWISQDSRVAQINDRLSGDSELAGYPFQFTVLALENGTATVSSPRSAELPAMRFLRTAYPNLSATAVDDPKMMAAQDTLAATQSRAAKLISSHSDVTNIRWVIDERWYAERGVRLNLGH